MLKETASKVVGDVISEKISSKSFDLKESLAKPGEMNSLPEIEKNTKETKPIENEFRPEVFQCAPENENTLETNIENTEEATERTSMFEDQTIDNDKLEELRSEIEPKLKLGKEHDGAVLRENLEQSMNIKSNPEISDAHHIVGRDTPQAAKKLKDFGIDCNDPANGILLPNSHESPLKGAIHGKGRHTAEYSNEVEQRMSSAATKEEGLDVLQSVKEDLYNGELSLHADAKPNK